MLFIDRARLAHPGVYFILVKNKKEMGRLNL